MISTTGASMGRIIMAFMGLMLAVTSALPSSIYARGAPLTPADDPFYQTPAGFESEEPGTILRQRSISVSFLGLLPDPVDSYQLLYRTTAINGSAIATVTTIFKPSNAMTDRFISFQTAYDSSATMCDPSYTYQRSAAQTDLITSAEELIMQAYLLEGYIVASPDYEGPDAAFSAGHLAGMGTLDGMRAVANFESLGLSSNPMIVGIGYSGGALATGWTASLQPSYAPELAIKGWVQGGTPANLTGTLLNIDGTLFSGFIPDAVAGLSSPSAYGAELNTLLNSILTSAGQSKIDYAKTHCAVDDLVSFAGQSVFSTSFQTLGDGLLYNPTVHSVMIQNTMGANEAETPTAPVFVYHASQDEIIPYADVVTLVNAWCNYGASVKFTTFANGGHATTEVVALPDAIEFVKSAFAGTTQSGCSRNTELKSILNPIALGVELEPIVAKLIDVVLKLGAEDDNVLQDLEVLYDSITW
ncbi:uncharacterized protein N7498_002543 [Penicillium cinerascens]|uniref:Uncharacterized protein n=1 Tax=Penicillium cinerascens TaxID=70096 RepID=A0A9W9NAD8_9EURO|nr:uncharacterized protein N7498_002543 [Penicillium cinerascens]KAJ5216136.1 hypothetical protein N7498_002543 [Penicillium cinerascens]